MRHAGRPGRPLSAARRRYLRGGVYGAAGARRRASSGQTVLFQQVFEGTGAPADTIVTFGMGFVQGDLQVDDPLTYRNTADSAALRTQVDAKTFWPDGSVCHAVLHVELPSISNGATITCDAVRGLVHGSPGSALVWATVTSGRGATATVGASTRDLIANIDSGTWFSGPLCIERRATWAVPSAQLGGIASMRLLADIRIYKDGSLWVDAWFRNDIALQANGGAVASMTASVAIDSTTTWSITSTKVEQYSAACRRMTGRTSGGTAAARPIARTPTAYLARAGLIPNYDVQLGVASSIVATLTSALGSSTWNDARDLRDIQAIQGGAGDVNHIGIHTIAQSTWLISGHKDAWAYMMGQAEAAGLMPMYFWDAAGGTIDGTAGSGGWLDAVRWPGFWIVNTAQRAASSLPAVPGTTNSLSTGQAVETASDTGLFSLADSHVGDWITLPAMLSGRRSLLDSALGFGHAHILRQWDYVRALEGAPSNPLVTGLGVNLIFSNQGRGASWTLRNISRAAFLAPAGTPGKAYLEAVVDRNWDYVGATAATWASQRGEVAGWIPFVYGTTARFACWQHDMLVSTVLESKRFRRSAAQQVLDYMRNYFTGRWLRGSGRYKHFNFVTDFSNNETNTIANYHTTWAALEAENAGDNTWPQMDGDYYIRGLANEAMYRYDASEKLREDHASAWYIGWTEPEKGAPGTAPFNAPFTMNLGPRLSITPVGLTRASVAPAITAGQGFTFRQDVGNAAFVGIVEYTGGLAVSMTETGGTAAGFLAVANSGVLTTTTGTLTPGTYDYTLTATNPTGTSATATLSITVTTAAPVVPSGQSFQCPSNRTNGQVAYAINWTGAALSGATINSGNPAGNPFAVNTSGQITIVNASALAALEGSSGTLSITFTNAYGNQTFNVGWSVVAPTYVPVITAGQVFTISNVASVGTDVGTAQVTLGTPSSGGSAATGWSIVGGSAYFSISSAGLIEVSGTLPTDQEFTLLTLRASNAAGNSADVAVTVAYSEAALIYGTSATSFSGAYSTARRLRSSYTGPLIRIAVGTAGGTEYNIGIDGSGNLDQTELATRVAGGPSWLVTVYDQTIRGEDWTETDSTKRLQFTNGSGAIYDMPGTSNNRPVARVISAGQGLRNTSMNLGGGLEWGWLALVSHDGSTSNGRFMSFSQPSSPTNDYQFEGGGTNEWGTGGTFGITWLRGSDPPGTFWTVPSPGNLTANNAHVVGLRNKSNGKGQLYLDGTFGSENSTGTWTTGGSTTAYARIMRYIENTSNGTIGDVAEWVIFRATTEADMNTIRSNIDSYYGS